jgi:hypothetical protein
MRGMDERRFNAVPILVAIVLMLLPPTSYICAYLLRGVELPDPMLLANPDGFKVRGFRSEWEATLFAPAAVVESFVTGEAIVVTSFTDEPFE